MADDKVLSIVEHEKGFVEAFRDGMEYAEGARDSWQTAAMHLTALRDQKAHEKYDTPWTLFCEQRLGLSQDWASRLTRAHKVLADLTKEGEAPAAVSERATRLLANVAPKKRKKVLKEAQKQAEARGDEEVKPRDIAAAVQRNPPEPPEDGTKDALTIGMEAEHGLKELQKQIQGIRKTIETLCEQPIGVFLNEQALNADLKSAWESLKFSLPHAICPYCGGDKCQSCKRQGWVPKPIWSNAPEESRDAVRVRSK